MKLAYVRPLTYLSPHSLMQFESDPLTFYQRRLGPKDLRPEYDQQSWPMAVGSAFDESVKAAFQGVKPNWKNIENEDPIGAIMMGVRLGQEYVACGAWAALCADGAPTGMEVEKDGFVPGTDVPIRGKIDVVIETPEGPRAIDFKVTGSGASKPPSPAKGYQRHFVGGAAVGRWKAVHPKAGIPLEEIKEAWAIQLTIYDWLLGGDMEPRLLGIDQIVPVPNGSRVVQIRTVTTQDYRLRLRDRMVAAWGRIQTCDVVDQAVPLDFQVFMQESRPRFW